jgi:hypothetical protein
MQIGRLPFTAAVFTWISMMILAAPKVYQHYQSENSYIVWSILSTTVQLLPLPFRQFLPTKKPKINTLQPSPQQHPNNMIPNVAITAIGSNVPQAVKANAGSLVQMIAKLFRVITWMDFFNPQANICSSEASGIHQ